MSSKTQEVRAEPPVAGRFSGRWKAFLIATVATASALAATTASLSMLANGPIDLPGPLDLRLVHNSGVAFGAGAELPVNLVISVTAAVTILLALMLWRGQIHPVAGGFILGGAVANIVDRIGDGVVVDMFDLGWWPTFNLADVWITFGVTTALLVATTLPNRPPKSAV